MLLKLVHLPEILLLMSHSFSLKVLKRIVKKINIYSKIKFDKIMFTQKIV